ncbi:hypothetical protein JHN46_46105 [Streptomyces sp. MBT33]|nr:hypothetical protein [Streptomyces sp. MBT33]
MVATDPRHPDTPAPAGGTPVSIDTGHGQMSATTTADGRFITAFVPTRPSVQLSASPLATDSYPGAIDVTTSPQSLHTAQAPVRFSVSTHALNLKQGTTGTVTGRAEVQTASGWQPLPHTTITLLGPTTEAGQTTTDSQGAYTLHVSSDNPEPSAEVVAGTSDMPFQQVATQPFSLHVAYTTQTEMSAFLNDDSSFKVFGSVVYDDSRAHWPAKPTVTLQYSNDGKSGWKTATAIPLTLGHNKPQFPETFARTITAPNTNAYWRARFNGNPDLATSTTKPVHLYRYATRITGFHASPDPARKSQSIRLSGTLQYKKGTTWKALSGGSPTLYFKPRGSSTYHYVCELDTDKHGHLIGMVTAKQDGTWALALSRQTGDHYLKSARVTDYVNVQ